MPHPRGASPPSKPHPSSHAMTIKITRKIKGYNVKRPDSGAAEASAAAPPSRRPK